MTVREDIEKRIKTIRLAISCIGTPTNWTDKHEVKDYKAALETLTDKLSKLERDKPEVVCLCGSTRFMGAFHEANGRLSLEGKIVLTVEIVTYDGATDPQRANPAQKEALDELHLRKIDLADRVLVLNVGGYIGKSTADEIAYAEKTGKQIEYLEPVEPGE